MSTAVHAPRQAGSELTADEQDIVTAHIPLVKKLTRKYKGYGFPDLLERLLLLACKVVPAWNSDRGTFGALFKATVYKRILNMARDRSRRPHEWPDSAFCERRGTALEGLTPVNRLEDPSPSPEDALIQRESDAAARRFREAQLDADLKRYPQCAHLDKPLSEQTEIAKAWLLAQTNLGRLRSAAAYSPRAGVDVDAMAAALRELMPPRPRRAKVAVASRRLELIAPHR